VVTRERWGVCTAAWKRAQAVATPELATAIADAAEGSMSRALDACYAARDHTSKSCHESTKAAFATCGSKPNSSPQCTEALKKGKKACGQHSSEARETCEKAFLAARDSNSRLAERLAKSATKTALEVASEARSTGISRSVAARAVSKATQNAMVVVAKGHKPMPIAKHKVGELKATRDKIRKEMATVVEGVQNVWKMKVHGAVDAAASKATKEARMAGATIDVTRQAAVSAAEEAADRLQGMAQDAEIKAGARVMGPDVEALVSSREEKDRRKFIKMAQPYLARADALLAKMQKAQDEEDDKKKKEAEKVRAKHAASLKDTVKWREHQKVVQNAGAWLAKKTAEVADGGEKVSAMLTRIAKEAGEAADQARKTLATASEAAEIVTIPELGA